MAVLQSEKIPVEPALDNASEGNETFFIPTEYKTYSRKYIMKKLFFLAAVFCVISLQAVTASGKVENSESSNLVIYAYDSFVSEWGPGPVVIPLFEEEYGVKVNLISAGDSGQVLQKAILEKDNPKADILIGIDNNLLAKALEESIFSPYKPENISKVQKKLLFDPEYNVIPFDYGFFSIIYDSQKIKDPPASLEDLLQPKYKKSLIMMDPRTSSPGLGFLLWTIAEYGDNFTDYWTKLKESILTVTDGWDTGYGLFTSGEAPMVLSYTTSPAYHVEYENTTRYRAAVFPEGHYMQIEGLGIVKNAPNRKMAEKFVEFALSKEFQNAIPLTNWMYPASDEVNLPDSFDYAPVPEKKLLLPSNEIRENVDKWLTQWTDSVTK